MMSWWSGNNTALDAQIEKATSSSLEDIALNLEISDIIRSKTVGPKESMRSLKRRIGNPNPNTQLSALNLTDTCVKNGGSHFLAEIASREFMDNLTSLLQASGTAGVNHDVRQRMLELIQSWAAATEGRHDLSYIGDTPVRVDDGCYAKITGKGHKELDRSPTYPHKQRSTSVMQPRNARVDDGFDEDLKKALAMSLEDANGQPSGMVAAPATDSFKPKGDVSAAKQMEEEDEDLKAAIAASLADMEEQKQQHLATLKEHTSNPPVSSTTTNFTLPKNDYELSPVEAENINLFSTLVDRLQTQPPVSRTSADTRCPAIDSHQAPILHCLRSIIHNTGASRTSTTHTINLRIPHRNPPSLGSNLLQCRRHSRIVPRTVPSPVPLQANTLPNRIFNGHQAGSSRRDPTVKMPSSNHSISQDSRSIKACRHPKQQALARRLKIPMPLTTLAINSRANRLPNHQLRAQHLTQVNRRTRTCSRVIQV
ncbi:uncharacterized protein J7T54_006378 [Emericellopsis cladophorae]|uniref:VHS domain-containing protein n=1 Tax=Emericellopsis cladophorae TaxID=2686198 RepID=A0A9P9Y687_9HYPO|nr:uncharacterized protein J7T54_006378 [Emericellopsis cladophorae]KAI6784333.1 hypothetical protein J7T54_006378 [Emericellopsis cladophorae]